MGCGYVFGRCANGEALHDAEVVVPLVGLDDGVNLAYLGNVDERGQLSGEIVRVASEEMLAYQGDNKIQTNQFAGIDLTDQRIAVLQDARPLMQREMGFGEKLPVDLQGAQITAENADSVFSSGIRIIESYVSLAVQGLNDQRNVEKRSLGADGLDDYDNAILGLMDRAAEDAGNVLDRLKMIDNLPEFAPMIIETVNEHGDITPEQKAFIADDITMGGSDAGFTYEVPLQQP